MSIPSVLVNSRVRFPHHKIAGHFILSSKAESGCSAYMSTNRSIDRTITFASDDLHFNGPLAELPVLTRLSSYLQWINRPRRIRPRPPLSGVPPSRPGISSPRTTARTFSPRRTAWCRPIRPAARSAAASAASTTSVAAA